MWSEKLTFRMVVDSIQQIHNQLAGQAAKAVNISLTLRNWLIGMYISEFELRGADRATYGEKLLSELARQLTGLKISNCNRRQLYRYLRFHRAYPAIVGTLSPQLQSLIPSGLQVEKKVGTASPQLRIAPGKLLDSLSYSHFELLMDIDEPLKRMFYEIESMRGNWSVRELKRQIASLYYERSGLSEDKGKLAKLTPKKLRQQVQSSKVKKAKRSQKGLENLAKLLIRVGQMLCLRYKASLLLPNSSVQKNWR